MDFLFRPDQALDFFDDVRSGVLDGFDEPLGRLHEFDRLEFFLGGRRGGRGRSGMVVRSGFRRRDGRLQFAFRRQAGGKIFSALDFVEMALFKQALVAALFADHVGAGLDGFAVRFLVRGAQAAFRLEAHSPTAPGEVVGTHN